MAPPFWIFYIRSTDNYFETSENHHLSGANPALRSGQALRTFNSARLPVLNPVIFRIGEKPGFKAGFILSSRSGDRRC
jgi:hypothetical protein